MTDNASRAQFVELVRWLASWSWPLPEDAAKALVVDHGWTLQDEDPGNAATFATGLVSERDRASFLIDEGVLENVRFFTAFYGEETDESQKALTDSFADQVDAVTEVLGKPRRKKSGARGSALWDLDNGAMLDVGRTTKSCAWSFTSPAYADVQRQLGR